VPISFTGLRPGEKLHEELMSEVEHTVASGVEKIDLVQTDELDGDAIVEGVGRLLTAAARGEPAPISMALHALVPEYSVPQITLVQDQASIVDEDQPAKADEIAANARNHASGVGARLLHVDPTREPHFPLMKDA
jgi:hypothetical protein